jgi:hypothetical protein
MGKQRARCAENEEAEKDKCAVEKLYKREKMECAGCLSSCCPSIFSVRRVLSQNVE